MKVDLEKDSDMISEMLFRPVTCCFSGHRPSKLTWLDNESDVRYTALQNNLYTETVKLYESGIRRFICGMALGADLLFCKTVLALRDEREDVFFEAAIPFDGQAAGWADADRKLYYDIRSAADKETYVSREYHKGCMAKRNRYMVDRSSVLMLVYAGLPGGTEYTMKYAMKKGLEIIHVDF